MSSNGTHDPRIVLAGTAPQPLLSAQRDEQRRLMAVQLEAVTVALNQQGQAIMALRREAVAAEARIAAVEEQNESIVTTLDTARAVVLQTQERIDALERAAAVDRSRTFWQRLSALVIGR
jgi:septal ring factor EnvC (AmiA/AmiB activator)